jgi:hypothetical protein
MALHFRGSVTAKPRRSGRASVDMYIRTFHTCVNGCFRDLSMTAFRNCERQITARTGLSRCSKADV